MERLINKVITKVSTKYGAPMGRNNVGTYPLTVTRGKSCRICKCDQTIVYDKKVSLNDGYDKGGVYWGVGKELRVEFTRDLSYIRFYRKN